MKNGIIKWYSKNNLYVLKQLLIKLKTITKSKLGGKKSCRIGIKRLKIETRYKNVPHIIINYMNGNNNIIQSYTNLQKNIP